MDPQIKHSNNKHENDGDNSDQNNRMKLEAPEEANVVTKITDVNDKCLVHIFDHLMLRDLINLADTCKKFQLPAQLAFQTKCRGKTINFYFLIFSQQPIKLDEKEIEISNITSALKVVRYFGSKIINLHVSYCFLNYDQKSELARYMNEYCADSLIGIKLRYATKQVVENWTKPFTNVESVQTVLSNLRDLNTWFPNMRRLVFRDNLETIKNTFPHLEELNLCPYPNSADFKESVPEILRLNPHLQKLRLYSRHFDMKFIEDVSEHLQSIRSLEICCTMEFFQTESRKIHLENVSEFHFDLEEVDSIPEIPFSFNQLEKLKLTVQKLNLNYNFENFIKQNPWLMKLTVCAHESTCSIEEFISSLAQPSLDVEVKFLKYVVSSVVSDIYSTPFFIKYKQLIRFNVEKHS